MLGIVQRGLVSCLNPISHPIRNLPETSGLSTLWLSLFCARHTRHGDVRQRQRRRASKIRPCDARRHASFFFLRIIARLRRSVGARGGAVRSVVGWRRRNCTAAATQDGRRNSSFFLVCSCCIQLFEEALLDCSYLMMAIIRGGWHLLSWPNPSFILDLTRA